MATTGSLTKADIFPGAKIKRRGRSAGCSYEITNMEHTKAGWVVKVVGGRSVNEWMNLDKLNRLFVKA